MPATSSASPAISGPIAAMRRRWAKGLTLGGLALALMATPLLASALVQLPADPLRDRMLARDKLSAAEIGQLIDNRKTALLFSGRAGIYDELAQAYLMHAELTGLNKPEGRKQLVDVIKAQEAALSRHPANTFGWSRLAYARLLYNGPSALVAQALQKSIESAPDEPTLMPSRVAMMVLIRKHWTPELKEAFHQQIRSGYENQRWDMMAAALNGNFVKDIYDAYADDPVMTKKVHDLEREWRAKLGFPPVK